MPGSADHGDGPRASRGSDAEDQITSTLVPYKFVGKASSYRWTIHGLQAAAARHNVPERLYSEPFDVAGVPWRVLVFPNGNGVRSLSLYLDLANAHALPRGWSCVAAFAFTVVNCGEGQNVSSQTEKLFLVGVQDWGFREFMPLRLLYDASEGYLSAEDTLVIETTIAVTPPQGDAGEDSADEADPPPGASRAVPYVGLANQGATCYLNSLLQTFYHLPYLRQRVYEVPVGDGHDLPSVDDAGDDAITPTAALAPLAAALHKDRDRDVLFALQQVFYHLQFAPRPVSTRELTVSFGWGGADTFRQHDVHELMLVMCDRLEERMKGTPCAGALDALFKGIAANVIECCDIDYTSSTEETFYDLQLNVKGCPTLTSAFEDYVQHEMLDGDNAYAVDGHGMQSARRRCAFRKMPPVLMLHLKRFEYDVRSSRQTKINERQEFPLELDVGPYLPSETPADGSTYLLHAVLVHSGDASSGHYYAFVRPDINPDGDAAQWYRFDDERVVPVSERDATEENFGGDYGGGQMPRYASAYVLTYVRKRDAKWVVPSPAETPPVPVHRRFGRTARRELRRSAAEAHLIVMVKVLGDAHAASTPGGALDFGSVDGVKVQRRAPYASLLQHVEQTLRLGGGSDAALGRYGHIWVWHCQELLNTTVRPRELVDARDDRSVEAVFNLPAHLTRPLLLYAHAAPTAVTCALRAASPPPTPLCRGSVLTTPPEAILLFVKHFSDSREQPLVALGRRLVRCGATTGDLWKSLCAEGVAPGEAARGPPSVFEEIRPGVLEGLPLDMPLGSAELGHGDVVIFADASSSLSDSKHSQPASRPASPDARALTCYEWCREQALLCDVRMCPVEQPDLCVATLRLSRRATTAEVRAALVGAVGDLGAELERCGGVVQLFAQDAGYQPQAVPLPESQPLAMSLSLGWNRQRRTLYYAVLPHSAAGSAALTEQAAAASGDQLVIPVQVISSTHGEVQETIKVVVPTGATVGALKARLIEVHKVLGDGAVCGFTETDTSRSGDDATGTLSPAARRFTAADFTSPQKSRQPNSILPISPPHAVIAHPRKDTQRLRAALSSRGQYHPFHARLRLYEVSEHFQCVTQCLWDPAEPAPAPSMGLALYCEDGGGDGQTDTLFNGASMRFAPGLSSLGPYQLAFSLLHRGTQLDTTAKPERFVVQVLRVDPLAPPQDPAGRGRSSEEVVPDDTEIVQPHSPPWLVPALQHDTIRDLRKRMLERPMPAVVRDFLTKGKARQPAVYVVREFNRCLRQPLPDGAKVVAVLSANVAGRMAPCFALAHPHADALRHDRRTGNGVNIRR
eukprot:TRINITY_DN23158_c0_g1_i1.p1 TRINITY_DN23158_c0_g1~~TRINITY_DN23158_c0_g1_i1.p1  ORF type:complete len:1311 (+),score=526.32 TRINITY_DN23158_c0_g1_i1:88-4020(+)